MNHFLYCHTHEWTLFHYYFTKKIGNKKFSKCDIKIFLTLHIENAVDEFDIGNGVNIIELLFIFSLPHFMNRNWNIKTTFDCLLRADLFSEIISIESNLCEEENLMMIFDLRWNYLWDFWFPDTHSTDGNLFRKFN